jgi:hypothetical protein
VASSVGLSGGGLTTTLSTRAQRGEHGSVVNTGAYCKQNRLLHVNRSSHEEARTKGVVHIYAVACAPASSHAVACGTNSRLPSLYRSPKKSRSSHSRSSTSHATCDSSSVSLSQFTCRAPKRHFLALSGSWPSMCEMTGEPSPAPSPRHPARWRQCVPSLDWLAQRVARDGAPPSGVGAIRREDDGASQAGCYAPSSSRYVP